MPMKFEELVGHVAGRFVQGVRPTDPITRVYANILRLFGEHAISKWTAVSAAGIRCTMKMEAHPLTGRPGVCAAWAAGPCVACQRTVCLMHAMTRPQDGAVVCEDCIVELLRGRGAPPPPRVDGYAERLRYLEVLELGAEATLEDIRRAFKRLGREHHPDGKTGRAKERAEVRMRAITEAYHWLMARQSAYAAA